MKIIKKQYFIQVNGFTLVEFLVATSIFLVMIILAASIVKLSEAGFSTSKSINETHIDGSKALEFLANDIAIAGYGILSGQQSKIRNGIYFPGMATGPLIPSYTFTQITGVDISNFPINPITQTQFKTQTIFPLLPINKVDNIGYGLGKEGYSDRLTVTYVDPDFIGGTQKFYENSTTTEVDLDYIKGVWSKKDRAVFFESNSSFTYDINSLKKGDIAILRPVSKTIPILGMVTNVSKETNGIFFEDESLGFNSLSDNQPLPFSSLDSGNSVFIQKVKLFTYLVDVSSSRLVRRRYTYAPLGQTGYAFVDDPVCENVEQLLVSYNQIQMTPPFVSSELFNENTELIQDRLDNLVDMQSVNVIVQVRSSDVDTKGKPVRYFALKATFTPKSISFTR